MPTPSVPSSLSPQSALTLLEVILVISLLAGIMVFASPNILVKEDYSGLFQSLQTEVKSAYDSAVLTGIPHRMVFDLRKKIIFLEKTSATTPITSFIFTHQDENLSPEEREEAKQERRARLKEMGELAGDEVSDFDNDRVIPPTSPLLRAQDNLMGGRWEKADDFGHQAIRYQGLRITRYRIEHLGEEKTLDSQSSLFYLYFLPQGYVEKAYIIWVEEDDNGQILEDQPPYVLSTRPFQGIAQFSTVLDDINPFTATLLTPP